MTITGSSDPKDTSGSPASSPPQSSEAHDVVMLHGKTEDGNGVRVLRSRPGRLEAGEIRVAKEGAPIQGGELVRLHAREGSPVLWDVEVQYDGREGEVGQSEGAAGHKGPARVATQSYRQNWDRIFGQAGAEDLN